MIFTLAAVALELVHRIDRDEVFVVVHGSSALRLRSEPTETTTRGRGSR